MKTTEMTEGDIASVSRLLRDSYESLASREGLTREQAEFLMDTRGSTECIRRESRSEHYLVARDSAGIAGVVSVRGDTITKLYVSPDRTGRGTGRLIYEAAESLIRAGGHRRVGLGAFPSAVPFYSRMGLSPVGLKPATGVLAGLTITLMEKKLAAEAG